MNFGRDIIMEGENDPGVQS